MNMKLRLSAYRRLVGVLLLAGGLLFAAQQRDLLAQQAQSIPPSPIFLTIETEAGAERFVIEIADEQKEREIGLMFRDDLPQDQGMLFDFGTDRMVTMWMRNTPLSLDMVFIDRSGTIVHVASDTTPFSMDIISSKQPVRYVLELNAGIAAAKRIRAGDKVKHPLIIRNLESG